MAAAPATAEQLADMRGRLRSGSARGPPATPAQRRAAQEVERDEGCTVASGADASSGGRAPAAAEAAAPAAECPCQISLRFLSGVEDRLEVFLGQRVHAMKSQICTKLGVTMPRVKLILGTSLLKSGDLIGQCGIASGSVVTVIVQPPLYQGSAFYDSVAEGFANSQAVRPDDDEVHRILEGEMEKRTQLNEAFVQLMSRRAAAH